MRGESKTVVKFRDAVGGCFLEGCIIFGSWGEAMGFISDLNRRERRDPRGRYARVEW